MIILRKTQVNQEKKTDGTFRRMAEKKLIHYYTRKNKTIMKIKNLYSFFTKLQTRIMNKTNIYHSQETKTKKDKERKTLQNN